MFRGKGLSDFFLGGGLGPPLARVWRHHCVLTAWPSAFTERIDMRPHTANQRRNQRHQSDQLTVDQSDESELSYCLIKVSKFNV